MKDKRKLIQTHKSQIQFFTTYYNTNGVTNNDEVIPQND